MINAIYNSLMEILDKEETNRLEQFRRAWDAYYGNLPKPLKVKPGMQDDNIRLNYCRLIVDKSVYFLFGKSVEFELEEGVDTTAEQWLLDCWQQNKKMTTLQKLGINGGVCGHCFIKILWNTGMTFPRLIVLDPETVTVTLAADDIDNVLSYKIQYPSRDPKSQKPIMVRQLIEKDGAIWHIRDQVGSVDNLNSWTTTNEQKWPYSWPPVVDCQNLPAPNEFWGLSDIEPDILEINSGINFVVSNMGRIIKFHAHPKTWGKGFSANELKIAVDETLVLPSPDAELHNLEMQTDLTSSNEFYKRLKEALHEVSHTPEVATGKLDSAGNLSGLALRILYGPLVEKTETKRLLYGDMLIELNRRLLEIGGFGSDNITELHWQTMLPEDEKQKRETALVDRELGVSDATLLTQLGDNADLEKEKKARDAEALGSNLLKAFDQGE